MVVVLVVVGKSLWCYTGFTWEEIHSHGSREMVQLAEMVDVLVDGRFVMALRDTDLLFRGSANQRLIDVPRTIECGCVCLWPQKSLYPVQDTQASAICLSQPAKPRSSLHLSQGRPP